MTENNSENKKSDVKVNGNIFVMIVIALIIVTFVISAGVIPGITSFFGEMFQEKIVNEDGTLSIPSMAQTKSNQNPTSYVGKVLGEKIQFGRDDNFNRQFESIMNMKNVDGYQKYQYARYVYNTEIERYIGMYNAKRMGITVSNRSVLKIIAKNKYSDSTGSIDYDKLRADINKINMNDSEDIKNELLLENYEYDYFGGLPVSYNEVERDYKLAETKANIQYAVIAFDQVASSTLSKYLSENTANFKQYKISKIVFSDNNKKIAQESLKALQAEGANYDEIVAKLKEEQKIINVIDDSEFKFIDEYTTDIGSAILTAKLGSVASNLVKESSLGYSIVKVLDIQEPSIANDNVAKRVKDAYVENNKAVVELDTKKKADEMYQKIVALESSVTPAKVKEIVVSYGAILEELAEEVTAYDNIFPMLSLEEQADVNYTAKVFYSKPATVSEPYKYTDGYIIGYLVNRTDADMAKVESDYEALSKSASGQKVDALKYDFYSAEKKRYKVVDNFNYAVNIQDFFDMSKVVNPNGF